MTERASVPHATPVVDVRLSVDHNMPAQARRATEHAVGAVDPDTRYNFLLMVSELVANAVLHSRSPKQLRVLRRGSRLRAEVYDGSLEPPVVLAASPHREHGRGMLLIDAFAADWGVETCSTGKVVWAEVETTAPVPASDADQQ